MSKLTDPGKDKKTRKERKTERLKVWKRPTTANSRTKGTNERKADWEGYIK
jgi:hypothetical protein